MTFQNQHLRQFSGLDTLVSRASLATEWGGFGFPLYAEFETHPIPDSSQESLGLHSQSILNQERTQERLTS